MKERESGSEAGKEEMTERERDPRIFSYLNKPFSVVLVLLYFPSWLYPGSI